MAAKTLNDFLLAGTAASDDFVVGFDTAVAGGERKWTVATIANAVSGVMTPELNSAFFNSTDVIPIANGGTGQTTAFAGLVALANGGASIASKYLKVNAGNTALEYDTIDLSTADVTGVLPVANGGTGGSTGGANVVKAWVNFDGTDILANISGTYSQSGTTVTVTIAGGHGLSQGQGIYSNITSGAAVDGSYTVASITSPTIFTYTAGTSLTTSGNITLNRSSIRSQYNVSSVTKNGTGDYNVNFTTPMADANYTWAMGSSYTGTNGFIEDNMVSQTINSIRMKLLYGSTIDLNSAPTVCITIFGN